MKNMSGCGVIILAAGQGKRMCSSLPKVLHPIAGKPLIFHILQQVHQALPFAHVAVVVGHSRELVESYINDEQENLLKPHTVEFIFQPEQKGTADAVRCVMQSTWGKSLIDAQLPLLVLPGDSPLITRDLLNEVTLPLKEGEALRLLSCKLKVPKGYGRVIREKNTVIKIVEEKDATLEEKKVQEVAVSTYFFDSVFLSDEITQISNKNAQKEYYLTDMVERAHQVDKTVGSLLWENEEDLKGVNDLWELAQADQVIKQRILKNWATQGVRILNPQMTSVDVTVKMNQGVMLYPGVILEGLTEIQKGAILGPGVFLKDVLVGENAVIKAGTIGECSQIQAEAQIGPYAHLRPDSFVGYKSKIGNLVELKKARIGSSTSIAHLSYLGDAEVGSDVNIGCGFVTCNFDGRVIDGERKHKTIIEDKVFLGSDCQAVAPVRIGKGAYVASGSTITMDVPQESLAIARSRQVNKEGYAKKLKGLPKVLKKES